MNRGSSSHGNISLRFAPVKRLNTTALVFARFIWHRLFHNLIVLVLFILRHFKTLLLKKRERKSEAEEEKIKELQLLMDSNVCFSNILKK